MKLGLLQTTLVSFLALGGLGGCSENGQKGLNARIVAESEEIQRNVEKILEENEKKVARDELRATPFSDAEIALVPNNMNVGPETNLSDTPKVECTNSSQSAFRLAHGLGVRMRHENSCDYEINTKDDGVLEMYSPDDGDILSSSARRCTLRLTEDGIEQEIPCPPEAFCKRIGNAIHAICKAKPAIRNVEPSKGITKKEEAVKIPIYKEEGKKEQGIEFNYKKEGDFLSISSKGSGKKISRKFRLKYDKGKANYDVKSIEANTKGFRVIFHDNASYDIDIIVNDFGTLETREKAIIKENKKNTGAAGLHLDEGTRLSIHLEEDTRTIYITGL